MRVLRPQSLSCVLDRALSTQTQSPANDPTRHGDETLDHAGAPSGMSTVAIVGAGHVGVVYAAGLAELGHRVQVVDIDEERVAGLRAGRIWFYEPGLPELLARGLSRRRLAF